MPLSTTEPTNSLDVPAVVERVHVQPLPQGRERILALVKSVLELPFVLKLEITPKKVEVVRMVKEGEDVLPGAGLYVDPLFMLSTCEIREVVPSANPFVTLDRAAALIRDAGLVLAGIVAPKGPLFGAYLGREDEPRTAFGYDVYYVEGPTFENRITLVGSPTAWMADAKILWVIDPFGGPS